MGTLVQLGLPPSQLSSSEDDQGCDPSSKRESPGSSDEFEREMESEVMSILELMASPVVVQVAGTSAVKCNKKQPSKCGKGDSGEIIMCKGRGILSVFV